jgi:hypothetical protein
VAVWNSDGNSAVEIDPADERDKLPEGSSGLDEAVLAGLADRVVSPREAERF